MPYVIEDGAGTGSKAMVDSAHRLLTSSESISHEENHTLKGFGFNVETPIITLTTGGKSGVLYFKNNEDDDIVITGFFNLLGEVTGTTSGNIILEYEFDTTGGTLVSTANEMTTTNKRVGDTNSIDAIVFFGAEGLTVDSGLKKITSLSTSTGINPLLVHIVLPKTHSVAISITPFVGTTNMSLVAALDCYVDKFI